MKKALQLLSISVLLLTLVSCQSIPEGATAVSPFSAQKYMGTWYEIARIDFKFEEDLNNTTATYSTLKNGKIKVVNRGYNFVKNEWSDAKGKAKFRGTDDVAELAVSFFGPFYGGYNVIALAGDYQYALVAGSSTDYLWILARKPMLPENIKNKFLKKAQEAGFDTSRLIWVDQGKAGK